jgi:hypothetical protein
MAGINQSILERFGFSYKTGGVHTKRTMMLKELTTLFEYVHDTEASHSVYRSAIEDDNCLGKRSGVTRKLTADYLTDLYMLDSDKVLFRALRYLWQRDEPGRPLLALLSTYTRDSIFQMSVPYILSLELGHNAIKSNLEDSIDVNNPGRFSRKMLQSMVRNIFSTWTQSGHLLGRSNKVRTRAFATAGSVTFALLLGYLERERGESLFYTPYTQLLDCHSSRLMELAEEASRKGWFVFKRIGNVIEVSFPNFITGIEMEWIREQN